MLGVEWPSEIVENFSRKEDREEGLRVEPLVDRSMFHTIDLVGSSDEDYEEDSQADGDVKSSTKDRVVSYGPQHIDDEVKEVVHEMVDFVERSLLFPEFGYDPQATVKAELMEKKEGVVCSKHHCRGGCLCSSLKGYFPHGPTHPTHCGKEICMFDCYCFERACGMSGYDDENRYSDKSKRKKKLPTRFKDVVLGKAYEKLHARTILDRPSITNDSSSSESEYECKTSLCDKPKGGSDSGSCLNSKIPSPEAHPKETAQSLYRPLNKKPENVWASSDKIASIRKTMHERRVGFLAKTVNDEQTLADVFIWCSQHNKYSCLCINYVFFSKTNSLLWKPSRQARYLANKVMFDIALKQPTQVAYEVFPYDLNKFSARTNGSFIDYGARNKDEVFTSKRKIEMENNVVSYSNSYVKFKKFLVLKRPNPVLGAEPFDKEESQNREELNWGKVVHIVKTGEKMKVDVGNELDLDDAMNGSDEGVKSDESTLPKVSSHGRKRKLTMKMMQLEEEKLKEKELEGTKEPVIPTETEEPVVTRLEKKKGRKPKWAIVERLSSEPQPNYREPTPDIELIARSKSSEQVQSVQTEIKETEELPMKQDPSTPDYFDQTSQQADDSLTKEDIICAPDIRQMVNFAPDSGEEASKIGKSLDGDPPSVMSPNAQERPVQRLSSGSEADIDFMGFEDRDCADSDEVDSIHSKKVLVLDPRTDGYPHLGLVCLTPGVGFLNVVESLPGRLVIEDPVDPSCRRTFDNVVAVNNWLNTYLRCNLSFSPPDLTLQWILVKPAMLKLKQAKPFNSKILRNPSLIVSRNGIKRRVVSKSQKAFKTSKNSLLKRKTSSGDANGAQLATIIPSVPATTSTSPLDDLASNLVPNPKYAVRMKRPLPGPSCSNEVPAKTSRQAAIDSTKGFVSVHQLSQRPKFPDVPPKSSFIIVEPRIDSPLPKVPCTPFVQPPELSLHPDVTIRPLPNLTKMSSIRNLQTYARKIV